MSDENKKQRKAHVSGRKVHKVPLRADCFATLTLPEPYTPEEGERLAMYVKAMATPTQRKLGGGWG
jgi:hypothetical protein